MGGSRWSDSDLNGVTDPMDRAIIVRQQGTIGR
jgi:hypothetical protein